MKKMTLSAIKADVGSVGGHTRPSSSMLKVANLRLKEAKKVGKIVSFDVTHTGDDICLLMVHGNGSNDPSIHNLAWKVFEEATAVAKSEGLYGAGQDLLKDAPSGNVRGAGPGAAEVTLEFGAEGRKAEPFLVFTGDKCSPGAFNLPLYLGFADPMFCAGLMLPNMIGGFSFTLIDMENAEGDRTAVFNTPEDAYFLASLLRDENRYGIRHIHSRTYPDQMAVSVSTDRLHTIAGEYKGKDDPVAVVRVQGFLPAPEELVSPYVIAPYVAGDARGSHHMPWMPVPINTGVTGPYCLPLVACVAYSVNKDGQLSERVDKFGNPAWDYVRLKAQEKAIEMRKQGFFGAAMLPNNELEYSSMRETFATADSRFQLKKS